MVCILLFSASLVQATPISNKKARLNEIMSELNSLDTRIEITDEQYNQASIRLQGIESKVNQTQAKLDVARIKLSRDKKVLNGRVKGIYKNGVMSVMDIVLSTKTFSEFLVGLDFVNRVGQNDAELVKTVKKAEKELAAAQADLKANYREQGRIVSTISQKKRQINKQIASKKSLVSGIEKDIKRLESQQRQSEISQMQSQGAPIDSGGIPTNAPRSGVVGIAMQQLGKPYSWGAAGPSSFDCSGLMMYCYAQVGVSLPHSSGAQYGSGQSVGRASLKPGDLVFFGSPIHHVGMYIGGGSMIHAPSSGDVVKISPAFRGDYVGACRP